MKNEMNQAVYWTATVGTHPKFILILADFVREKITNKIR